MAAEADLPIQASAMRQALPPNSIAAITEPAFAADWSDVISSDTDAPPSLNEQEPVIGVKRNRTAKAYPLRVMQRHEVVNDEFAAPTLVTYCPLCGSSIVAEPIVDGSPTTFGVSGLLWRGDLVLYDSATESLWSQLLLTAINGPQTGDTLRQVPSRLTSLAEWRREHPDTAVLLPPPKSGLITGKAPESRRYGSAYDATEGSLIGFDGGDGTGGLSRVTLVVGVVADGESRAYPYPTVRDAGVVTESVGGLPVVVTTTPGGSLAAYRRDHGGRTLTFAAAGDRYLRADGSRWERATGRAVDGPHEGAHLSRANDQPPMFWTGWSNFHPNTSVYGR